MPSKVQLAIYSSNPNTQHLTANGICHTSVVVFNREFEYTNQGLTSNSPPGTTLKGMPGRTLDLGRTELDEDTFKDYLEGLSKEFLPFRYNINSFNGNTFAAKTIEFLVGAPFPSFLNQPQFDPLGTFNPEPSLGYQNNLNLNNMQNQLGTYNSTGNFSNTSNLHYQPTGINSTTIPNFPSNAFNTTSTQLPLTNSTPNFYSPSPFNNNPQPVTNTSINQSNGMTGGSISIPQNQSMSPISTNNYQYNQPINNPVQSTIKRTITTTNIPISTSTYNTVDALPTWPTHNILNLQMMQNLLMSNYKSIIMTVSPKTTFSSNSNSLAQAFYQLGQRRAQPGSNIAFMRVDVQSCPDIANFLGFNDISLTSFTVFKGVVKMNVWQDTDVKNTMNALEGFLNEM